jgi:hypothetical protein
VHRQRGVKKAGRTEQVNSLLLHKVLGVLLATAWSTSYKTYIPVAYSIIKKCPVVSAYFI